MGVTFCGVVVNLSENLLHYDWILNVLFPDAAVPKHTLSVSVDHMCKKKKKKEEEIYKMERTWAQFMVGFHFQI